MSNDDVASTVLADVRDMFVSSFERPCCLPSADGLTVKFQVSGAALAPSTEALM